MSLVGVRFHVLSWSRIIVGEEFHGISSLVFLAFLFV